MEKDGKSKGAWIMKWYKQYKQHQKEGGEPVDDKPMHIL